VVKGGERFVFVGGKKRAGIADPPGPTGRKGGPYFLEKRRGGDRIFPRPLGGGGKKRECFSYRGEKILDSTGGPSVKLCQKKKRRGVGVPLEERKKGVHRH